MKQLAVEKLELSLLGLISFDSEELRAEYKKRITNAKEMEKQQKDKFAVYFCNWICSEETVDLIQDLQIVGELSKIVTTKELLEIFKKEKGL